MATCEQAQADVAVAMTTCVGKEKKGEGGGGVRGRGQVNTHSAGMCSMRYKGKWGWEGATMIGHSLARGC